MCILFILILTLATPTFAQDAPQLARNPKLAPADLELARAETLQAGGANAELIYAARLDAIQKGSFNCVIIIYTKPARQGKDYFAAIVSDGQRFPLAADKQGRALNAGDHYLRMGLKHEEGKSPLLRLIGAVTDPVKGDQQRNLDFRFDGKAFLLENKTLMPLAK